MTPRPAGFDVAGLVVATIRELWRSHLTGHKPAVIVSGLFDERMAAEAVSDIG